MVSHGNCLRKMVFIRLSATKDLKTPTEGRLRYSYPAMCADARFSSAPRPAMTQGVRRAFIGDRTQPDLERVMMQEGTTLEVVLRRDRLIVLGGLVGISALAWAYLGYMAWEMEAMDMAIQ